MTQPEGQRLVSAEFDGSTMLGTRLGTERPFTAIVMSTSQLREFLRFAVL
jgi:hypothetical protein